MGAAASVKLIYSEGMEWFKKYFDGMAYVEDFRALDKNGDGGITFDELQTWLRLKAKQNATWNIIVAHPAIFRTAHMFSSKNCRNKEEYKSELMINGLDAFKQFLIHLFVLSILWVHFKSADEWNEGNDTGNERLNYDEFKLASRTFCSAQANEELSEDKIRADFALLDVDKSGSVEFIEVCAYCTQFMDLTFSQQFSASPTKPAFARSSVTGPGEEVSVHKRAGALEDGTGVGGQCALEEIMREMKKNERIAAFEQIKVTTERNLGLC